MNSEPLLEPRTSGNQSVLDPLNVGGRIEELKLLERGWLDGKGLAPSHEGLDWLSRAFDLYFPEELPPSLYPTAEAGVRAEWSAKPFEISLEIDLIARSGNWHSLNLDNDTAEFRKVNLNDARDWDWFVLELRLARVRGDAL